VVGEGLAATDWVVTRGLQRVRPGIKVEPKRVALTISEAASGKKMGNGE
jgi:multidrug efflux system membrane fusion protein